MDEPAVEIGRKERARFRIIGQSANARSGVEDAGECGVRQIRHCTGRTVDLINGARAVAGQTAELALHEARIGRASLETYRFAIGGAAGPDDVQAERRCRRCEDARWPPVVAWIDSERKNLADVLGGHIEAWRRIDQLAGRRATEARCIEDA